MSTLQQLRDSALAGMELVVTPAHTLWQEHTGGEEQYTERAIEFAADVWRGTFKHERSGRLSPSGMGGCERALQFGYQGAPRNPVKVDDLDLMAIGTKMHLMWQMEGLSAGYLTDAEVWVTDGDLLGGSMDGILYDDSIFELKTMRSQVYAKWVAKEKTVKFDHLLQTEAYFRCSGRNRASLLYQDRDSGQTHEWRLKSDPRIEDALDEILQRAYGFIEVDALPTIYADCQSQTGFVFKQCSYSEHCLAVHGRQR